MNIEVQDLSLGLREFKSVVVLVGHWTVRAWTVLEASRGRHVIYLLCKVKVIVFLERTTQI